MLGELFWVVVLTLTPTLELRASIPYAMLSAHWSPWQAAVVCILANTALAPLLWLVVARAMALVSRVPRLGPWFDAYAERKRAGLHRLVERYGVLGLAVFIGVPLPGTGVYSGCVAAYLLGFRFRDFLLASFLGCVLAGVAVTAVVGSGSHAFDLLIKEI